MLKAVFKLLQGNRDLDGIVDPDKVKKDAEVDNSSDFYYCETPMSGTV